MAELHDLRPNPGSHRNRKRVGRGPGSGTGKMPLQRRIPKGGFTPLNRVEFQPVNIRALDSLAEVEITPEVLRERGLIGSLKEPVKILGTGVITRAVSVRAHAFSGSAREKIEAAGGSVSVIASGSNA
jgi:large subunit ribosomal protein L15